MWKTISKGPTRVEQAIKQFLPPCQVQCPINEDIQRTNVLISLLPEDPELATDGVIQIGDYLYERNPLFNICGYVCGLCELECNYQSKGERSGGGFSNDSFPTFTPTILIAKKSSALSRTRKTLRLSEGAPAD